MKHVRGMLRFSAGVLAACLCLFVLLLPLPAAAGAEREVYLCAWEDGTVTEESYASAYDAYAGADETVLYLSRGGRTGTLAASGEFSRFYRTVQSGDLSEMLNQDPYLLRRIEKLAAFRLCANSVWLDSGDCFVYTGAAFAHADFGKAESVNLIGGSISARELASSGATFLRLYANARIDARSLEGTSIRRVAAEPPYSATECAVYLDTAGGRRLVCGLPAARSFVMEACDFADEGALLPCKEAETLDLPFLGNAASGTGTLFRGELAHLFSTGTEYRVPQTLKRVRIRGGVIVSHAFYRCASIEEIDACGVRAEQIEQDAFLDCTRLLTLHSPRADVLLYGNFRSSVLPCGCTLFERI